MRPDEITWRETRERLRQDRERLSRLLDHQAATRPLFLTLYPPYTCCLLHRVSHYWYRRDHRLLARFFWHLNLLLTGADIGPLSDIGGGLVVLHPVAVTISARAGRNLTMAAHTGAGTGTSGRDVGAGPGLPVLGDDVEIAPHAGVLGPVRIGDRVRIGPGCVVMKDVPDDTVLSQAPVEIRSRRSSA